MKPRVAAGLFAVVLAACASPQRPEPVTTSAAALPSAGTEESVDGRTSTKTAAEEWAERKVSSEAEATKKEAPREALDPLAMGSELEESSIPNVEVTPPGQVRAKGPGELTAAVSLVRSESTIEGAVRKLTQRLGKPSWTESPKGSDAKRRVWVAASGGSCHRLVLEADGSVEVEPASKTERRMLTASARQNPCTGEIERGITSK